jgi:hypothetical protein
MSGTTILRGATALTAATIALAAPLVLSSAAFAVDATLPPVANTDSYATTRNVPIAIDAAAGLLANDTDGGNGNLRVDAISLSDGGTLAFAPDGSFVFTPDPGFFGTAHFIYIDLAGDGYPSNYADVWIEVAHGGLIGAPDFYVTPMDTQLVVSADRTINNDPDSTHVGGNDDATGEIDMNVYGEFTYTPAPGFVGIKTFSYWLAKDGFVSEKILVTIEVTPIVPGNNDADVELPTLAYTGTVSEGLLAPGLALLALGGAGLALGIRRSRTAR